MKIFDRFNKAIFKFVAVLALFIVAAPALAAEKSQVTRVILARHGQTEFNRKDIFQGNADPSLNATGFKQAELLAQALKNTHIDVFISTPFKRAIQTTEKVAALHNQKIAYTDVRFKTIDFGDLTGMTRPDAYKKYPEIEKQLKETPWLVKYPGGESFADVGDRGMKALEDAVKKYPGKTIFIGAHRTVNRAVIIRALGMDPSMFLKLGQDNTCINVLEYENGQWRLMLLNSTVHLNGKY